ncbi:MAG: hypothetical protein ACM3ZV_06085 [Bacillota bacterium]
MGDEAQVDFVAAWRKRTAACAVLLLLVTAWAAVQKAPLTALYLVQSQGVYVLPVVGASVLLVAWWRPRWPLPAKLPPWWVLLLLGIAVTALLGFGAYWVFGNFPLARDVDMVLFDMAVFDKGRLVAPIAPQWQPFALALEPEFLLNSNAPTGFISSYLPMNALLRLAFSRIADPAWFNPVLALVGGAALLDVARRLFPEDARACWAVLLVYALSAQMLVTAMTPFAMTGHMALNLLWLAAFLRGGKVGHSVAIVTGFVATGLHQFAFHPFFVAPFLLWKLREREWKVVLLYGIAYAAIVLWWLCYPILLAPLLATAGAHPSQERATKVLAHLIYRDPRTLALMILNLLRFVAWQNIALWPLLIAAVPIAVRERGLPRALLLGILVWIAFVAFTFPSQGRGWGYRYLHGYLGSFALLAGFGYRELEQRIGRRADGMVILLSGITIVVSIPVLVATTHAFMQPHLRLHRLIQSQRTPFVVIDDTHSPSTDGRWSDTARDHVRNSPDLDNRPLRFSAGHLTPPLLAELCRRGPITLVTRRDMHRLGFILNQPERSPQFDSLVASMRKTSPGCARPAVG